MGLGGLEVHYRHFATDTIHELSDVATRLGLTPTGGSDFHGDLETYAQAHATTYVPDSIALTLHEALARADADRAVSALTRQEDPGR